MLIFSGILDTLLFQSIAFTFSGNFSRELLNSRKAEDDRAIFLILSSRKVDLAFVIAMFLKSFEYISL